MQNNKKSENFFYNENIYKLFEAYIERVFEEINTIESDSLIEDSEKKENYIINKLMNDSYITKDFISSYRNPGKLNYFGLSVKTGARGSQDELSFKCEKNENSIFELNSFFFRFHVKNQASENFNVVVDYKIEKKHSSIIIHDNKNNLKILLKDEKNKTPKFFILLNANDAIINDTSYPLEDMIITGKDEKTAYNNLFKLENNYLKFNFEFFSQEYNELISLLYDFKLEDYSSISISLDAFKPRRLYYEEKKQLTKKNKKTL